MNLTNQQAIDAPVSKVYAALNDPLVLQECIPGCEKIEMTSESTMDATVTLKIGPIKASFDGALEITDLNPPSNYTLNFTGKGGTAGEARGSAKVALTEDAENQTLIDYDVQVDVSGKIAQVGSRLITSTANVLTKRFFKKFADLVKESD